MDLIFHFTRHVCIT